MNFISYILILSCATFGYDSFAADPEKKSGKALRISDNLTIDGKLNETVWEQAENFENFTQIEPNPGKACSKASSIKVLYSNDAIYVGAFMEHSSPDSILRELTIRDEIGNADWFGVFIDAYKDGNNGVGFIVTASGVQTDIKYSVLGEDGSWNAVWQSAVEITDKGWFAEFKIPYSALRFPDKPEQEWHINFMRYLRSVREKASWSTVNPKINGFFNQAGLLKGISGIQPPLRLQLLPYVSAYYLSNAGQTGKSINGGLDVKYGLSDAFTLDMTLVPDFGQVQSDNTVLNLSPFEVRFQENRQFFTEGIELFNKGDLFYSRRIGSTPFNYSAAFTELKEGETIKSNPTTARLVNATKVSGRTSKGLGIGVFNAVTKNSFATLVNEAGDERKVLTDPATNYNVFVLDQNLKNNGYVTLINTNTTRNGSFYDANVTGLEFIVQDKNIKYAIQGNAAVSQQYGGDITKSVGLRNGLNLGKVSGNFVGNVGYSLNTDKFDPNDLGFQLFNNTIETYANSGYRFLKPFGKFNRAGVNAYVSRSQLYKPAAFNNFGAGADAFFILRSFDAFGGSFNFEPITTFDYFEPRTSDYSRYYRYPTNYTASAWVSSDYRKKFAYDINLSYRDFNETGRDRIGIELAPRFRVNDHLSFVYSVARTALQNDVGYAVLNGYGRQNRPAIFNDDIIFGIRDQVVYTNVLNAKYTFNNKMGLTFRMRHYWSKVEYDNVYRLDEQGNLASTNYTGQDAQGNSYHNNSYNAFNIDMVYSWVFSPGSEFRLVWKNAILKYDDALINRFDDNLKYVFEQNQSNSLSLRFLYFIDYASIKRKPIS